MGERVEGVLASLCAAQFASGLGGFDFSDLDTPFFIKQAVANSGKLISSNGVYRIGTIKACRGCVPQL